MPISSNINLFNCVFIHCRPFVVMPIPNSNLILLIKDLNCPVGDDSHYKMTVEPEAFNYYNMDLTCYKSSRALYRRRPTSCINQHKNVRIL